MKKARPFILLFLFLGFVSLSFLGVAVRPAQALSAPYDTTPTPTPSPTPTPGGGGTSITGIEASERPGAAVSVAAMVWSVAAGRRS